MALGDFGDFGVESFLLFWEDLAPPLSFMLEEFASSLFVPEFVSRFLDLWPLRLLSVGDLLWTEWSVSVIP